MAEYHMNLGYISRSGGKSAAANSAYIACTKLEEERTGLVFDYSNKKGLLHEGILAPDDCPEWVYDKQLLWESVEAFEDYIAQIRFRGHSDPEKNAKSLAGKEKFLGSCLTAFTANFALPLEIENPEHLIELSQRIVKGCYVQNGLIAQYAIHSDKGNPHLHILSTTRAWEGENFSKRRFVIEREKLIEIRHQAAEITNEFGREKGYNYLVDARSYADRGLNIIPTRHLGPNAHHKLQESSRIAGENNKIHQDNVRLLLHHPEELVKLVTSKKVVFTQADIEREVFKRVGGDMHLYSLLKTHLLESELLQIPLMNAQFEESPSLSHRLNISNDNVHLKGEELKLDFDETVRSYTCRLLDHENVMEVGKNLKDEVVFTTKEAIELEQNAKSAVQQLCTFKGKEIFSDIRQNAIIDAETQNTFDFSEEQKQAIEYLLEPHQLRVLKGNAGTGKTTILKPVVEAYKGAGYLPLGVAFQGKVSELLGHELGIAAYTLDQLQKRWKRYDKLQETISALKGEALRVAKKELEKLAPFQLTERHVVVLDEGNMVEGRHWQELLSRVQRAGAHLRVVQDNKQIKALFGLDISRLVENEAGHFELKEVHRQKEPWMRAASAHLNDHDLLEGFKPYAEHGCLTFKDSIDSTRYALAEAYVNNLEKSPEEFHIALAFQNRDVEDLNGAIRHQLKQRGSLGANLTFKGKEFAVGDRIVFTENDHTGWFVKTVDSLLHSLVQKITSSESKKGVKNGTFGQIEALNEEKSTLDVRLLKDNRRVRVNLKTYNDIDYGYAMTVNKAEGQTFDWVYGLFDRLMNANNSLIWMTRHRFGFQGFITKDHASNINDMAAAVGRSDYRPLIADFDSKEGSASMTPEAELLRGYLKAAYEAGNLWGTISRETPESPYTHSEWVDFQAAQHERNHYAEEILKHWEGCQTFVNQAGLKKITLEVQAGLKDKPLNDVEVEALQRVESYRAIAHQARILWDKISKTEKFSKTSALIKEHEDLAETRNHLAYEIASFPGLHRPFFKVTRREEGLTPVYVSYGGDIYEKFPASFKAAEKHSEAYMKNQRQKDFSAKLTSVEKGAFAELIAFKKQVLDCGRLAAAIKTEGPLKKRCSPLKSALEESSKERDFLAFKIIKFYDKYSPLLERADILQDKLLKYAVFGEVRQLALKHSLAKTIEKRFEFASQLHRMVGEGDRFEKPLFGILKGMGVDFGRVRFERGWFEKHQKEESLPFKTVEELSAAFVSLREYRKALQQATKESTHSYPIEQNKRFTQKASSFVSADVVKGALIQNMTSFADDIFSSLGENHNRAASTVIERRYGRSGGISVNLRTGAWVDHRNTEVGGGPLEMLTKLKGFSFKEAVDYGASWAGILPEHGNLNAFNRFSRLPLSRERAEERLANETAENQVKIERAKALWEKGQSIQGTLAELYLREHRKIAGTLPDDLRYLPSFTEKSSAKSTPGLMVAARSPTGDVTAVQITFLDSETAQKANVDVAKKSFGVIKGSAVTLQTGKSSEPLFIAEGVETALSLKEAEIRGTIKASLGLSNIKRLDPVDSQNKHIIICGDHDTPESPAARSLENSVLALQEKGFQVTVIKPNKLKEDFNDVLKTHGPQGVREILARHLPQEMFVQEVLPIIQKETSSSPEKIRSEVLKQDHSHHLSAFYIIGKSFQEVSQTCEKRLFDLLRAEKKALTSERSERISLQAEKTTEFLMHSHVLKGKNPTADEMTHLSLRAKYELDRLPEIRNDLIEEWKDKDKFKKKYELLAHLIAERRASIEGRLYFEAKQRGLKPPPAIAELAKKELNENRKATTALTRELAQKYALSEKAALYCAKNTLRYKEIHGATPSEKQISKITEIAKALDEHNRLPTPNNPHHHEMDYLSRKEGDLCLREMILSDRPLPSFDQLQHIQAQATSSLNAVSSHIEQEHVYTAGKGFSL